MINCWRPLSVDTPTLKVASLGCIVALDETSISDGELIQWLRCRQSLVSQPSAYFTISLCADNTVNPISMESLNELTLRNVGSFVASRYLQYPSIATGTTLRIAPFIQLAWSDRRPWTTTAMDRSVDRSQVWWPIGSGGPPGILSCNIAALPNLANIFPDLCTITVHHER